MFIRITCLWYFYKKETQILTNISAQVLIDKSADVKKADNEGNTVLHLAAYAGFEAIVSLLIKKGAQVNIGFLLSSLFMYSFISQQNK